jgi:hypothetical protein
METRVGNHQSHGVVIAGVSCIAGKFWIINVELSTPTTYQKMGHPFCSIKWYQIHRLLDKYLSFVFPLVD